MPYRIVITLIENDVPYEDESWEKLRNDDKLDPSGKNESYGYVTKKGKRDVNTQVFDQRVDELDMPTVIKAVNGLK